VVVSLLFFFGFVFGHAPTINPLLPSPKGIPNPNPLTVHPECVFWPMLRFSIGSFGPLAFLPLSLPPMFSLYFETYTRCLFGRSSRFVPPPPPLPLHPMGYLWPSTHLSVPYRNPPPPNFLPPFSGSGAAPLFFQATSQFSFSPSELGPVFPRELCYWTRTSSLVSKKAGGPVFPRQ